ncbi:FAD-binding oxidoreductase [Pedobacter hartonius]|uniref:FAD/FMN-containing dehydrogenase n=1 Tax=Pedobacter hartonius TaxID=425514 RepID=A0A1H4D5U2_9SPHI|nr:FAD-binding oxidoreductase [Pedobacter hartonius]SEA68135.1 FAD/FMN-containing dehydrogenase [Pedobacter hartonius]
MNKTDWNQKAVEELEDFLKNKIVLPGTEKYAVSYQGWAATDNRPAMICLCETTEDVQAAVVLAQKKNIRLSVRGGGHDWQGRAFADGGLVADLTKINTIEIDAAAKTAVVGGGTKIIDLTTAAGKFDLVHVTPPSGEVGITGFTLGGGYGLISPSCGMAADNLLSAEVVLANGSLVVASPTENEDLLWALRGGGGNFGVVTSLIIRLHPAKPLLAGRIMFGLSEAKNILKGYNEIMKSAPDELYVLIQAMSGPDGKPVLMAVPNWFGDPEEGQHYIDAFRQLGTPIREQISQVTVQGLLESFAPFIVNGRRVYTKTRWLSELQPGLIDGIAEAIHHKTSPLSVVALLEVHGATTKVAVADTAFGLRDRHFVLLIGAEWIPEEDATSEQHKKWVNDLYEMAAPFSLPGGYATMLGSENDEQVRHAYGSNLPQLRLVKQKYDPNGIFTGIPLGL